MDPTAVTSAAKASSEFGIPHMIVGLFVVIGLLLGSLLYLGIRALIAKDQKQTSANIGGDARREEAALSHGEKDQETILKLVESLRKSQEQILEKLLKSSFREFAEGNGGTEPSLRTIANQVTDQGVKIDKQGKDILAIRKAQTQSMRDRKTLHEGQRELSSGQKAIIQALPCLTEDLHHVEESITHMVQCPMLVDPKEENPE